MTDETNPATSTDDVGYEHQDIGAAGVLYFLLGLAVAGLLVYFIVDGLYHFLDRRSAAEQAPINPLVTNAPTDTRHIPKEYNGDYEKYLKENFPAPQLEVDERGQLNGIRLKEEETLSTYDWIDKSAGTVRIPIDRAMDLIAQRGLPVRQQAGSAAAPAATPPQEKKKEYKK
jgi:hypothetical protein